MERALVGGGKPSTKSIMLRHLNQRAASLVGRTATSMLMRTRTVSNKTRRAPKPINTVINFVPQQQAWVIESMGKYSRVLNPGVNVIVPVIENIAYVHSLKENAIVLPSQTAITRDNVILHIDGVLYMQIVDPHKASYGVEDAEYAVKQLAMTTMRSEIGYMTLDEVFKERAKLNHNIVQVINDASSAWGVVSKRCEISDVQLSDKVVDAMQMQVSAERKKRARVLESEGMREAVVNQATGEAEAILKRATATAAGIKQVACAIEAEGGHSAVSMNVAEQYVQAFGKLAKTNNTILLPAATGDVASMVTQAMSIFKNIRPHTTDSDAHPTSSSSSPSATTLSTTTPLEDSVNVDVSADAEFEEALARAKRIPGTD